jgi:multidrug efflux pump subunit AcrB
VTVADVATVRRGVVDPPASLALVDGREAVILALRMAPERRVDRWAAGMRAAVADFAATLPAGIALDIRFDQSAHTDRRLADLAGNLALGAALVVGVLMVTLGWRAALVVATALPLTSLAALAALNAWGVPIHQMSVTGLIVALGLVVDSAIVMTDAVRAGRARGLGPAAAVSAAADRLWLPLASATVTTILAFMPIALMPGSAGEFVGPIAYSVILALVTSYAVAMTVVPALAGRFLAGAGEARGRLAGLADRGLRLPGAARLFRRAVRLGLDHPRLSMLAASLPAVLGVVGMTTLPEQFFPPSDRAQFRIQVFLSDQASIERTQAVVAQADRALAARPEILAVDWVLGGSAPKIYYNVTQDQDRVPSYAEAQVSVRSVAAVARLIPELQGELDRLIPEARVLVRPYLQGPPVDAPVEIRIFGPEPSQLREIGEAVRRRLAGLADVTHVTTDLEGARPVLTVVADEAAARLSGLTPGGIARQLDAALAGAVGGTVVEGAEEMPVRVRVAGEARLSVAELSALALMPPGIAGEAWAAAGRAPPGADGLPAVPLTALAALALTPRASAIARRDGERVNAVVGHVGQGVLPATVLARLTTSLAADPVALPPGYRLEVGGDAAERDKAVGNLAGSLGLIAVLSVATLVLTFNAFRFAAVVAAVAGLSMGLGLLALTLAGYPFGFVVIVGLLGLAGVAINAAIIILSALKADPRALAGDRDRIADIVASDTSRHILSTTLTTFGGFLPLMLAPGGFWPPFAVTIAGGVALTTLVSFWFVPAAFSLLARPAAARAAAAARGPAVA